MHVKNDIALTVHFISVLAEYRIDIDIVIFRHCGIDMIRESHKKFDMRIISTNSILTRPIQYDTKYRNVNIDTEPILRYGRHTEASLP